MEKNLISVRDMFPAQIISVQSKPFIFSDLRIRRDELPESFQAYDLSGDGLSNAIKRVQTSVLVNFLGTIVGIEPVKLDELRRYFCQPDPEGRSFSSDGAFIGETVLSFEEYENRFSELMKKCKEEKHGKTVGD